MSRGHGKIQRSILAYIDGNESMVPVSFLAFDYAMREKVPATDHLRASFRRAAYGLADQGLIGLWLPPMPSNFDASGKPLNWRMTLCVTKPDVEHPSDEDMQNAYLVRYLFNGGPALPDEPAAQPIT